MLCKLIGAWLVKEVPAFYVTYSFIISSGSHYCIILLTKYINVFICLRVQY